jgi:Secretion system C-terminal sorting domain
MKKLILSACSFLITSCALMAQSSLLVTNISNGNAVVTNGAIIFKNVGATVLDQTDFNIKNIGTTNKTYKMRMYYDVRHVVAPGDSSDPYFCFGGSCYSSNTFVSIQTQTLAVNQDVQSMIPSKVINIHYDEASMAGLSSIRYRIYDIANPSVDYTEFTIKYNDPTASVKNNATIFATVSDVYPNPSSIKALLTVTSLSETNTTVTINNTLGAIVASKTVELNVGKNNIPLDIENLNTGIYFVTIANGSSKIVKKFTINK